MTINHGESRAPSALPLDDVTSEIERIQSNFEVMRAIKRMCTEDEINANFSENYCAELMAQVSMLDDTESAQRAIIIIKVAIKRYKKHFSAEDHNQRAGCVFTGEEIEILRQCQIDLMKNNEVLEGFFRIAKNSPAGAQRQATAHETRHQFIVKNDPSDLNDCLKWELVPFSDLPITWLQSHIQFWLEFFGEEGCPSVPVIVFEDLEQSMPLTGLQEVQRAIWQHESDRQSRELSARKALYSPFKPKRHTDAEQVAGAGSIH